MKDNEKISIFELSKIFESKLTDSQFDRLSKFIHLEYGIKMPPAKKIMLQSRLQKRLRELKIDSFNTYVDYVFSKDGEGEIIHMIDVVSTNKTDFFREPTHFDYLKNTVLPEFVSTPIPNRQLKVWSAACSSGEEVYTIAMVLAEFFKLHSEYDFSIFGSDISTRILQKAKEGIYAEDRVNVVPLDIKKKYILRSKDSQKKLVRIVPALRSKVNFARINFMDQSYPINETFDIIFCRNVLIYFDRQTQENVINKLCKHLKPNGYFFLGHSESITGINVPLKHIKPTVFRKI